MIRHFKQTVLIATIFCLPGCYTRSPNLSDEDRDICILACSIDGKDIGNRIFVAKVLGERLNNVEESVALLSFLLADKERNVRVEAILSLGKIGEKASPSVPLLLRFIGKNSNIDEKRITINALGKIGPKAMPALEILQNIRDGEKEDIAYLSCFSIFRISGDSGQAIIKLTEGLKSCNEDTIILTAQLLGSMGSLAKNTLPLLINTQIKAKEKGWDYACVCIANAIKNIQANYSLEIVAGQDPVNADFPPKSTGNEGLAGGNDEGKGSGAGGSNESKSGERPEK